MDLDQAKLGAGAVAEWGVEFVEFSAVEQEGREMVLKGEGDT